MTEKIKLGISSCLLGNLVRFDGTHQLDLDSGALFVPVAGDVIKEFKPVLQKWYINRGQVKFLDAVPVECALHQKRIICQNSVSHSFYWKI